MEMVKTTVKITGIVFYILAAAFSAKAQPNYWDVPLTEHLISHNKKNYIDNQKAEKNQFQSQATVTLWQKAATKYKKITDSIDKRLTSVFIITSDAWMLYKMSETTRHIYDDERKSLSLAYHYPFTVPEVISAQKELYKEAEDLALFTSMVVLSYGDVSKMKASSRKMVYNEVLKKLSSLRFAAFKMYTQMQIVAANQSFQKAEIPHLINRDKEKAREIIQHFKF